MLRRTSLATLAIAIALPLTALQPASPQQVASAGAVSQVDSWGVGWLGANEGALPAGIWANTNGDALLPIYASLQPRDLAPSARVALRHIVLSKTKAPTGGAVLVPERLRLIEQLGETGNAVELRKRYPDTDWGKLADLSATSFDLAAGNRDVGCGRLQGRKASDPAWMPVRAFCAALKGDFDSASVAGEQVANTDEALGVWLMAAIETMRAPTKTRPDGRYGTPFEAAVSLAAKLSAPANSMAATPPDIAAAIVTNKSATLEQRRAALRPALDAGRIKPSDVLAVLTAKEETPPAATAKPANSRAQAPRPDALQLALAAFAQADAKPDAKAAAYAEALKDAESLSDARLASAALADAIKALPRNATTLPYAEAFARAALLMSDEKQAGEWRKLMDTAPKDSRDAWAAARIDLMLSYSGVGSDKPGGILDRLIAAAPPIVPPAPGQPASAIATKAPAKPVAAPPADKQLDLRRIENTRALFLYAGTGRDLSPAQRALLATQKTAGRGVSDSAIARIASAADQDAKGEAALAAISLLGPDVSALSFAGLSDVLTQLRRAGLTADADAIALESLQVWKAL